SALGKGSTFTLWLPLELVVADEMPAEAPALRTPAAPAPKPEGIDKKATRDTHPAPAAPRPKNAPPIIDDDRALMKPGMPKT
ncbi:hypothetical protein NL491_28065, partial [Klebsiella pneumoniae]|nr:hypothetical protein [Klebsiella pneumoniae]